MRQIAEEEAEEDRQRKLEAEEARRRKRAEKNALRFSVFMKQLKGEVTEISWRTLCGGGRSGGRPRTTRTTTRRTPKRQVTCRGDGCGVEWRNRRRVGARCAAI